MQTDPFRKRLTSFSIGLPRTVCSFVCDFIALGIMESVLTLRSRRQLLLNPCALRIILVPSATRLKMSLTSSSGCTKKFEFFHWLTKNECAAEVKITKLYAFHFTSGPDGGTFAGALHEKKSKTNGDLSRSIRRNRLSFHVTKEVRRLQRCHSRS